MSQILTKIRDPYALVMGLAKPLDPSAPFRAHIDRTNEAITPLLREAIEPIASRNPHLRESLEASLLTKRDYDRAWFVRLGFESVSEEWALVGHAMVAPELSYAADVILDDIVDQGITRFGRPCLYSSIGSDAAIYVAEILRSLSRAQLLRAFEDANLSKETLREVLVRSERTLCDINYGQYLDVTCAGSDPTTFADDDYLRLVHFTTGVDIANCLVTGALLGGTTQAMLPVLERIGSLTGILMQVRDDLLDYAPSAHDIDKNPGRDIAKLRMRLPYLVARRHASPEERSLLDSAMSNADPEIWSDIRHIVLSSTTVAYIRDVARGFTTDLNDLLQTASVRPTCRDMLLSLSNEVLSLG